MSLEGNDRWARWYPLLVKYALENLDREYPHAAIGCEQPGEPWERPSKRHPVFFGAFDWHSAVHNHWLLLRAVRLGLAEALRETVITVLGSRFTAERLAGEKVFLELPGNRGFERPYGLGWLLMLISELQTSPIPEAIRWRDNFRGLEALAVERLSEYFEALQWPVRAGTHANTAFSLNLCLEYAEAAGDQPFRRLLVRRGRAWFEGDRGYNPSFEPSGEDFLSPGLEEIMLMTRILPEGTAGAWMEQFLPVGSDSSNPEAWLLPVRKIREEDGRLVHLAGLNLARARILKRLDFFFGSPEGRESVFGAAALEHLETGLGQVESGGFQGTHWLPTFAILALDPFSRAREKSSS